MKKAETTNKVVFRLVGISTEQFATFDEAFNSETEVELGFNLRFVCDHHNRYVGVLPKVAFLQNRIPFLIAEAACHFEIDAAFWDVHTNNTDAHTVIPKQIITHMAVLAVGTLRGILHSKTEKTPYNRFFLPTINLTTLIEGDVEFVAEQKIPKKPARKIKK